MPVRFGWLYAMAFVGCVSHPFFDWLNVSGIRLLEPFSSQWFYGDTLFIIDPWLWALLIAVLVGLGMLLALAGLVVVIPLVAHASWHAYRDLAPT